jgi:hypothetical protein
MNKEQSNNNPWADKLDQVSLPDLQNVKQQLFSQLDNELSPFKNNNRRLCLLVLLLLLLIGVCNCPGIRNSISSKNEAIINAETTKTITTDKKEHANDIQRDDKNTANDKAAIDHNTEKTSTPSAEINKKIKSSYFDSNLSQTTHTTVKSTAKKPQAIQKEKEPVTVNAHRKKIKTVNYTKYSRKNNQLNNDGRRGKKKLNTIANKSNNAIGSKKNNAAIVQDSTSIEDQQNTSNNIASADTATRANADSIKGADAVKVDSVSKPVATNTFKKVNKEKNKNKWALAIGFNQFVPLTNQHYSGANANGKNNIIGDYIPVPQLRYYMNDKWFLQIEAAINSPQYIPELLIGIRTDSLAFGQRVYLKKLYYLHIPVSIYYYPMKNLYTGAGFQFSVLTNAAAFSRDSITITPLKNFKSNPFYRLISKNEMAIFADIGYQWKDWSVGARYNQAFGNFINTTITGIGNTKSANRPLQFYLRYTFCKLKSKKESTGK